MTTNQKIKFLHGYVKRWHQRWHKKNPDNIVGFRIGKKVTAGVISRFYSIIFQVQKKKKGKYLDKEMIIPEYFLIKFPDGTKKKVKTDVEQTGIFRFQGGIASRVKNINSSQFGSVGLFVTDSNNRVFALTNYHVVAGQLIANNIFYYRRHVNQNINDVRIILRNNTQLVGRFEEGILSREVDVAFVEQFVQPTNSMNTLPDQNRIQGKLSIRPYPPSFIGKPLRVYSYYNPMGKSGTINYHSSILHTGRPNIYFQELLQISPRITQGGDSGGIVVTPSFSVLGLIIGADAQYSYAIPFFKIDDFKNVFII